MAAIVERHGLWYFRLETRPKSLRLPPADPLYQHVRHAAGGIEGLRALLRD